MCVCGSAFFSRTDSPKRIKQREHYTKIRTFFGHCVTFFPHASHFLTIASGGVVVVAAAAACIVVVVVEPLPLLLFTVVEAICDLNRCCFGQTQIRTQLHILIGKNGINERWATDT